MHEDMQVSSKKICVRGILFKGKSSGKVPMAILKLLEFPKKRGAIMHPDPLIMIQKIFGNSEIYLRATAKYSVYFQKQLTRIFNK